MQYQWQTINLFLWLKKMLPLHLKADLEIDYSSWFKNMSFCKLQIKKRGPVLKYFVLLYFLIHIVEVTLKSPVSYGTKHVR